jgi:hypothetical protein
MLRIAIATITLAGVLYAQTSTAAKKTPPAQGTTAQQDKQIEGAIKAKLEK